MASGSDEKELVEMFVAYCNFGVSKGDKAKKETMTDKNMKKCFTDCKLYTKSLTSTDTDIGFSKVKEKGKKEINFQQFEKLLKEVSPKYKKDKKLASDDDALADMKKKIVAHPPAGHGTTKTSKTGGVSKMTDTSQYTGAHKERFGADGKGKGIEGRKDVVDNTGYVGNYKGKDTFDANN